MAADAYCPNCFAMIPAGVPVCPVCSAAISDMSDRDFREKLLHALQHPLDDVRMRAIIALGLRGEEGAAMPLAECVLRHPTNIEEGLEVVARLSDFPPSPDVLLALRMLSNHKAHAVREAATKAMRLFDCS